MVLHKIKNIFKRKNKNNFINKNIFSLKLKVLLDKLKFCGHF